MVQITTEQIKKMSYVELMAFLEEINRPPGGKDSIKKIVQNCFITKDSKVLDIGCNTGYCAFEINHLIKCRVIGIDIDPNMIKVAKKIKKNEPFKKLIDFKVADARKLPFRNEEFDIVICGGSTAFMTNREKSLREYKRVLKSWGFVADINFYYQTKPPTYLIQELNQLMKTNIKAWGIDYWLNLYKKVGLEKYFIYTGNVKQATQKEIKDYCNLIVKQKKLTQSNKNALKERLIPIMSLFNENNKHLVYSIFILRKRPVEEQVSLFGV